MPFQKEYQSDIDAMMRDIALEFKEPIYSAQSKKIVDVFELPANKFWVAINDNKVVGTIRISKVVESTSDIKVNVCGQSISRAKC